MAPWWLTARIDTTVDRNYVSQHLLPKDDQRLDRPLAYARPNLADKTYWLSLRDYNKRFFLILVDMGMPEQIFGIIDDGWGDSDLPLSLEDVERLRLSPAKDERVDRKFFLRQFHYVLKPICRGEHRSYGEQEVIPLDTMDRFPALNAKHGNVDKVRLPNEPDRIFCRRKIRLKTSSTTGNMTPQEFMDAIAGVRPVQSPHIVSYWASYTHQGFGYILVTPVSDFNLKSFLSNTPSSFKALPKRERRKMVIEWILCLVDTLSYLHSQDRSHCHIKTSTVLLDHQNNIFLSDSTRLNPDSAIARGDKLSFDREGYDYAAPEQWYRPLGQNSPPNQLNYTNMLHSMNDPANFRISRGFDNYSTAGTGVPSPNPSLNPQQADIFSVACIILELLSYLLKRSTSKFAAFRSAKHKTAGRGGAVLDASFHRNLTQVEAWMSGLAREASKKAAEPDSGSIFRGIIPILHVLTGMLSANPQERPPAALIRQRIHKIVTQDCGITRPHCSPVSPAPNNSTFPAARTRAPGPEAVHYPVNTRYPPYPSYETHNTRTYHYDRPTSSDGFSQESEASSSMISSRSSERESDIGLAVSTGLTEPRNIRAPPGGWKRTLPYMTAPGNNQARQWVHTGMPY